MLAGIVRRKLAAAEREVVKAGGKTIEVARVRMNGGGATSARKPERQPRMSATQKFQELTYTMRPQDSSRRRRWDAIRDRNGGDYPDNMPQAITVTDAQGWRAVYVPIRIGGKIVVPAPAAQ